MTNAARKQNPSEARYEVATVAAALGAELTVRTARGDRAAMRAASCLVEPGPGDEVALVITADDRVFVIAVLVSAKDAPLEIVVDGDLQISARGGSCRIAATDRVELRAEGTMSLTSKVMSLRAEEGNVLFSKLTVLAKAVLAHTDAVQLAAKAVDGFFERVSHTAKLWHRKVEELDSVRAGRVDYRSENEMTLRSENFLVGARNLAKLDAEQVHIG